MFDFVDNRILLKSDTGLTVDEARANGWTVPDSCEIGVGREAFRTIDPQTGEAYTTPYNLRLRYDNAGSLIGIKIYSTEPASWPFFPHCPPFIPECPFDSIPEFVRGSEFPGVTAMPHFVAEVWFRDPADACGGSSGGNLITKFSYGHTGSFPLPTDMETATLMGFYDTATCVANMGTHVVFIPTTTDVDKPFESPSSMVLLYDVEENPIGFEFVVFNPYTILTGGTHDQVHWEPDNPRPDKPFLSDAWHFWWIPVTGDNTFPASYGPATIDRQCINANAPGLGNTIKSDNIRYYDGTNNNLQNPMIGSSFSPFGRYASPYYPDGLGANMTAIEEMLGLPKEREISNTLFSRPVKLSPRKGSDMQTYFGMVLTIDICGTGRLNYEPYRIDIPTGDPYKDPYGQLEDGHFMTVRATYLPGTGLPKEDGSPNPRLIANEKTSYIDADWMYGTHETANYYVRAFQGGNLTYNWFNQNLGITEQSRNGVNPFKRGDFRVNKSPPLIALHNVFLKEHNRRAYQMSVEHPDWSDEELFQAARTWVISLIQSIGSREYLAAVTGKPLDPYEELGAYNPDLPGWALTEFCHAAFRYGHAELRPTYLRADPRFETHETGNVLMRDAHWTHQWNDQSGDEPFLRGLVQQQQASVDMSIIDDVRNHYARPYTGSEDLAALNIFRGREVGLQPFNSVRVAFGLAPYTSYDELTDDEETIASLIAIYGEDGIDRVELFAGGLAERHVEETNVGETFLTIIRRQFFHLRHGDRFWFENSDMFDQEFIDEVYATKLEDIIARNTEIDQSEIGSGIFFIVSRQLNTLVADGEIGAEIFDTTGEFFEDASLQLSPNYRLWWKIHDDLITFQVKTSTRGWLGIGFEPNPNTMKGADIYFCRVFENGTVEARDSYALDVGPPRLDIDIVNNEGVRGVDNVIKEGEFAVRGKQSDGQTYVIFTRPLDTGDRWDKPIPYDAEIQTIFAFNPTTDDFIYHGPTRSAAKFINFYTGRFAPKELVEVDTWVLVIVGVFAGILTLITLIFLVLVATHVDHFRFMSPMFVGIILVAALIVFTGVFVLLEDPPEKAGCVAYIWLIGFGFMLFFSALFAKTFRVWKLISSKSLKAQVITNTQLLLFVGIFMVIECIFLIVWSAVDTPEPELLVDDDDGTTEQWSCETDDAWWIAFCVIHGTAILVGVILSVLTRNLPAEFNDAAPIAWSMYNLVIICIIAIPIGFGLGADDINIRILIMGLAPLAAIGFTLIVLFGPVVWRIVVQRKEPRQFKSTIGGSSAPGGLSGLSSGGSTSG
eukprot:CAMPEP_0201550312 /NCGR_PEP_ID=MMETSP0173_2-20130828/6678_1 /ASSEMBLY_ACC=CAM_ASM_000268 /TAXON_ID=218659 /ORGANISM="Vexillifera sp., Strain DIVA3 564/2" /LENGTH=1287 /DNA_ID=CAMNT_0047960253 /DNA_START=167 /DNA_END=4030 /DNA_ORIENTATION=+